MILRIRLIVLSSVLCFASGHLSAQMKSGYRIGVNLTSMSIRKDGNAIDAETPVGIQFGAMSEIPFNMKYALQYGLLFSSKGTDYKIDNIDYSIAPAYIEVPVHAVYYSGRRSFRVSVFTGPYFACAFGGYKLENEFEDLTFGRGRNKDLKFIDCGFDFGTSINYKGYVISFQYGIGLRNVSPRHEMIMRNQVIGITFGTLLNPAD